MILPTLLGLIASSADSLPATWDGRPLLSPPLAAAPDTVIPRNRRWLVLPAGDSLPKRWPGEIENYPHQILTWAFKPIDLVVRPTFRIASYPLKPMIQYADSSALIERGNALMRLGEKGGSTMLYPVATLTGNSSSKAGLRFRHTWAPDWNSDMAVRWSPSQEWGVWLSGNTGKLIPEYSTSASYVYYETPGAPIWVPGTSTLGPGRVPVGYVSETRQQLDLGLGKGLANKIGAGGSLQLTMRRDGLPVRLSDRIPPGKVDWVSANSRGTDGLTRTIGLGGGISRSDQDHQGTPTRGGVWYFGLNENLTEEGAAMMTFTGFGTRYFLLGKEKYVFRRSDLQPYLDMDPGALLSAMDPSTLWQRLTERRVLALYWKLLQGWEHGMEPAPWFFFPTLGGNAPARAYDTRLNALTQVGAGAEYRWPIWKYLDGSLFVEAVQAASLPWEISYQGFAPGWGIGLRVRSESSFFFRLQMANGRTGTTYFLTTSPEF
ncbi:MAG: hypothetical protein RL318_370 [Fibrobacterota bacterium]